MKLKPWQLRVAVTHRKGSFLPRGGWERSACSRLSSVSHHTRMQAIIAQRWTLRGIRVTNTTQTLSEESSAEVWIAELAARSWGN